MITTADLVRYYYTPRGTGGATIPDAPMVEFFGCSSRKIWALPTVDDEGEPTVRMFDSAEDLTGAIDAEAQGIPAPAPAEDTPTPPEGHAAIPE